VTLILTSVSGIFQGCVNESDSIPPIEPHDPVNPDASPEARELLRYLYKISGKKIISGQHNFPGMISQYSNHVKEMTGKYPALWGQDFGFTAEGQDGINNRQAVIDEAKRQWSEGSIITI